MLRARGRELLGRRLPAPGGAAAQFPDRAPRRWAAADRSRCAAASSCTNFSTVTATLQHVGPHGLLYLDNASPANGYTSSDISRLGTLFDQFMYPIDTTAFGRESDSTTTAQSSFSCLPR